MKNNHLMKKILLFISISFIFMVTSCFTDVEADPVKPRPINAQDPKIVSITQNFITTMGKDFTLSVEAESLDGGILSYEWFELEKYGNKDGVSVGNTSSIKLNKNLPNGETEKIYYYYVVVTNTLDDNNDGGIKVSSVTSSVILVTVDSKIHAQLPTITVQPDSYNGSLNDGDNVFTLLVDATNSDDGTLSYQWYKSNDSSSEGIAISGATSKEYVLDLTSVDEWVSNYFYCKVTNTISDNGDGGKKISKCKFFKINYLY